MCGILFMHGPSVQSQFDKLFNRLKHRGPDCSTFWKTGKTLIGFHRLSINDKSPAGMQPRVQGNMVGVFNAEVYNAPELISSYGLQTESTCDTNIILPLFDLLGEEIIDVLDGFYSGLIFDHDKHELYCLRDRMGKKPLFVGKADDNLFVTSELKVFSEIDTFAIAPKGISKLSFTEFHPKLLRVHKYPDKAPPKGEYHLRKILKEAVRKRIPKEEPFGLFLSGGLDSSIIALLLAEYGLKPIVYILGDEDSPDSYPANTVVKEFGFNNIRRIPLPDRTSISSLIEEVVYFTESYNPSIISNGLATYLLSKAARTDGLRVVLSGEGADELFGGYHYFKDSDPWQETRSRLIEDMHFTELRRLDNTSMAHSIEVRCPFLDRNIIQYSQSLGFEDQYSNSRLCNKVHLRNAFSEKLPDEIVQRRKTSFDVGSGLRELVVTHLRSCGTSEKESLLDVWKRHFRFNESNPYFHSYPVFDKAIEARGVTHK